MRIKDFNLDTADVILVGKVERDNNVLKGVGTRTERYLFIDTDGNVGAATAYSTHLIRRDTQDDSAPMETVEKYQVCEGSSGRNIEDYISPELAFLIAQGRFAAQEKAQAQR